MKFTVSDMTCGHCKAAIEQAVHHAGGHAKIDLDHHSVIVTGIDEDTAERVIRDAGYSPVLHD